MTAGCPVGLLEGCRLEPEDDGPRLALADWLEERGDDARAEFVRLQMKPPTAFGRGRQRELLSRHGGRWLGPLWRWPAADLAWHRGLLAAWFRKPFDPAGLGEALPWLDAALLTVRGHAGLQRAAAALGRWGVNHATLDVRGPLGPGAVLDALAGVPASASLRTLTVGWPPRRPGPGAVGRLLRLPLAAGLTHLASPRPLTPQDEAEVREAGLVPVLAARPLWAFGLPPAAFRRTE